MSKGKSCKSSKKGKGGKGKGKGKASKKNQSPTIAPRSDRRLKTDISVIGNSPSGIPIYKFKYKRDIVLAGGRVLDHDSTFVGTMAQDLLDVAPDAVVFDPVEGYYRVDYSKIDVDFYKI